MRKMFFLALAATALLLMVPAQNAQAQSETPRVEIGLQYSRLSLHDFDATDHGVGTRLTMNITDGLAVEGEVNFFPRGRDNLAAPTGFSGVSQRTQGLFGVKYGMRSEKAGIFGKINPVSCISAKIRWTFRFLRRYQPQPNSRSISAEF